LSAIALKIAQYAPGGVDAFASGYQARALTYVESRVDASSLSTAKAVQYYALACVYYATYGVANPITNLQGQNPPGWLKSTNWISTTVDPCSGNPTTSVWYGVECSNNKITQIDLNTNRLSGSIPNEISLLSADNLSGAGNINYIDLYSNGFLFNDGDAGLSWIGQLGSNMGESSNYERVAMIVVCYI
jgi:hypothetical protein